MLAKQKCFIQTKMYTLYRKITIHVHFSIKMTIIGNFSIRYINFLFEYNILAVNT